MHFSSPLILRGKTTFENISCKLFLNKRNVLQNGALHLFLELNVDFFKASIWSL